MELLQTIKNKKQIEIFAEQNIPVSISELNTYNIFFYITVLHSKASNLIKIYHGKIWHNYILL